MRKENQKPEEQGVILPCSSAGHRQKPTPPKHNQRISRKVGKDDTRRQEPGFQPQLCQFLAHQLS